MRQGRHLAIPESRRDLLGLWETARRLTPATCPKWLAAEDAESYRLVASLSLAGLSTAERAAAEREFEAAELGRLVVDEDGPSSPDARRVYVARPHPQAVWSIGIRMGGSPWSLDAAAGAEPVLTADAVTDAAATSVADPFLFRADGRWQMFFEVDNWRSWKGEIGLATSADGLAWRYEAIVLAEPFHLSYPQVFAADDGIYMVPESSQAQAVRLYRARRFPWEWEHVGDLLRGLPFADSSLLWHGDRWWLFTETSGGSDDTLRLYSAPTLAGPWAEHPASPIIRGDASLARPAGRIVAADGRLVRFAQNCRPAYGTDVRPLEILTLTPDSYAERPLGAGPILGPGAGWNTGGMHHVDAACLGPGRWLAAVDGWRMEDVPA